MAGWLRNLGRMAGPKVRKGKWLLQSMTGSREDELRAEHDVGRDMAAEVRRQMGPGDDPEATRLVEAVSKRLARCVTEKGRTFQVEVVQGQTPNAFALPGGFVFVTRPLIEVCERREAELAFVIAHEMAHIMRGHALDRVLSDSATSVASRAIAGRTGLGAWLKHVGVRYVAGAYSRDRELAADALGARLADAAGYDREAAVRLLARLDRLRAQGLADALGLGEYFASHPPTEERVREVRKAPPV